LKKKGASGSSAREKTKCPICLKITKETSSGGTTKEGPGDRKMFFPFCFGGGGRKRNASEKKRTNSAKRVISARRTRRYGCSRAPRKAIVRNLSPRGKSSKNSGKASQRKYHHVKRRRSHCSLLIGRPEGGNLACHPREGGKKRFLPLPASTIFDHKGEEGRGGATVKAGLFGGGW